MYFGVIGDTKVSRVSYECVRLPYPTYHQQFSYRILQALSLLVAFIMN